MRVSYRFSDNFSQKDVLELKEIGINVNKGSDVFVIYEDDPLFEKAKERYGEKWMDNVSVVDTEFTEKERSEAEYLSIMASKMLGYLQPEDWDEDEDEEEPPYPFDIYPYYQGVFEVAGTSPEYGMLRGNQIGSLSLSGEPKWGKSGIGSTFGTSDNFFTTPEIYKLIFEPLGIQCRQVLGYGNQKPLETVVQVIPQGVSESALIIKPEHIEEISDIKEWGIKKYLLIRRGFFPSFEKNPGKYDFFVSQEYFGTGGSTGKETFISQRLYTLLKENKIKGLGYYPVGK